MPGLLEPQPHLSTRLHASQGRNESLNYCHLLYTSYTIWYLSQTNIGRQQSCCSSLSKNSLNLNILALETMIAGRGVYLNMWFVIPITPPCLLTSCLCLVKVNLYKWYFQIVIFYISVFHTYNNLSKFIFILLRSIRAPFLELEALLTPFCKLWRINYF
jgi:hypothetical protein